MRSQRRSSLRWHNCATLIGCKLGCRRPLTTHRSGGGSSKGFRSTCDRRTAEIRAVWRSARQAVLIIDAGSGLRELGADLNRRWNTDPGTAPRRAHLLITHAHLDHTVATPFNEAFYDPRNHFSIWAPQPVLDSLTALLGSNSRLRSVYSPLHFDLLRGIRELRPIQVGEEFEIEGTRISTHELNHPSGCVAYRFERGGCRLVFASDHEHLEVPDRGLAEFARCRSAVSGCPIPAGGVRRSAGTPGRASTCAARLGTQHCGGSHRDGFGRRRPPVALGTS